MLHPGRAAPWAIAALLLGRPALAYDPGSDLYQAKTIVTGTDARERPEGFRRTLLDVLVKASGNPAIAAAPGIDATLNGAGGLVQDYRYEDRMWQIPLHDEQGTEDRPYDLIVRFDPQGVQSALARLGRHVWTGDRPPLLLHVTVERGNKYAVTADGNAADSARQAAALAGGRYAMRVVLPPAVPGNRPGDRLAFAPVQIAGALQLDGALAWSDRDSGYDAQWVLAAGGREHRWGARGASLDQAFRNAVAGALKILSGSGEPG